MQSGETIAIEALTQRFDSNTVLDGINVHLAAGQVLALLGPSGCGKTTLLKLLAGLLAPTSGRITLGTRVVADTGIFVNPEKRGLGMVFQDYALWPHMTVGANVAFPLTMRGIKRTEARRRASITLERVGLGGFDDRKPTSLSGGQQQRVALARALVAEPGIVLFDEPLSNLDRDLRESLSLEIATLLREVGATAVYVTHDQEEAFTLADEVAVMQRGRIRQCSTPERLMTEPQTPDVARFLKLGTLLPAIRTTRGWQLADNITLEAPNGACHAPEGPGQLYVPHGALTPAANGILRGKVIGQRYRSGHYATTIRSHDDRAPAPIDLTFLTSTRMHPGESIGVDVDWPKLRWFAKAS